MIPRLINSGWQQAITTSTHMMFFKGSWQCTVHRVTGEVCFKKRVKVKIQMHNSYEEGIE